MASLGQKYSWGDLKQQLSFNQWGYSVNKKCIWQEQTTITFLSSLVIVHNVDPELYVVTGEDFPGWALLPAPTEALVVDEGPITALCVLQVKLGEKTQRIIW